MTTRFRFLNAAYHRFDGAVVPYHMYVEHFNATNMKSFICSKTWGMDEQGNIQAEGGKCLGCQMMDEGAKNINRRVMHAFNGLHMIWFHLVPATDKTGKPMVTKAGQPLMNYEPCKGRACPLCKQKVEKIFGKQVYLQVGVGHFDNIVGFGAEIERSCACGGRLLPVTFSCAKCNAILLDVSESEMDDETLYQWAKQQHQCSECNHTDILISEDECDKCSTPRKLEIFDVTVDIKRQGDGPKTTIQIPRWEAEELPDELKEKAELVPLDKVLVADNFDWQAKALGIDNPYKEGVKPEDHAKDYDEPDTDNVVF
jgi:hypothetical protein